MGRLLGEYDLLAMRDSENKQTWEELKELTKNYVAEFEKHGEIFKNAYEKNERSEKYQPKIDYKRSAEQELALTDLKKINEEMIKSVENIKFKQSSFSSSQKLHKEVFSTALNFRSKLLNELENPITYKMPS